MRYRRRILEKTRTADRRLIDAVAVLAETDGDDFVQGLGGVRSLWGEHLARVEPLQSRATRVLKQGSDVAVTLQAEHETVSQLLDNLSGPGDDKVRVATRQQLQALVYELKHHVHHDERRLLRPLIRHMATNERKELARSVGSVT